jgi:biotin carboxyl carrier protein
MPDLSVRLHDRVVRCTVERAGEEFLVHAEGATHRLRLSVVEPGVFRVQVAGHPRLIRVARDGDRWFLHIDGQTVESQITPVEGAPFRPTHPVQDDLAAPMPGAVTQVLVRAGDAVRTGQALVIIEAMKMEHVIRAPRDGLIHLVHVRPGDQVEAGAAVAELSPKGQPSDEPR